MNYWEWFCRLHDQNVFLLLLVVLRGLLHGLVPENRARRPQVPWQQAMVAGSEFDIAAPMWTARHLYRGCQFLVS